MSTPLPSAHCETTEKKTPDYFCILRGILGHVLVFEPFTASVLTSRSSRSRLPPSTPRRRAHDAQTYERESNNWKPCSDGRLTKGRTSCSPGTLGEILPPTWNFSLSAAPRFHPAPHSHRRVLGQLAGSDVLPQPAHRAGCFPVTIAIRGRVGQTKCYKISLS